MHIPVLLKEVIEGLDFQDGDIYLDATLGNGGHMEAVAKIPNIRVSLMGIDADSSSIEIAKNRLSLSGIESKTAVLNFREMDKVLDLLDMKNPTKILFDLGWNSLQFEELGRGFSFQKDEPLIMSFKSDVSAEDITAYDVINSWQEENLADIIYGFGEEKYARRIAKKIVEARKIGPIQKTFQLVEIIKSAVPTFYKFSRLHPATKTFQAIRIAVNDELRSLQTGLEKAFSILQKNGRMAVISFHSLEDRIVKNFFKLKESEFGSEILNKKPIIAKEEEIELNPRSRSAKLRIIKK